MQSGSGLGQIVAVVGHRDLCRQLLCVFGSLESKVGGSAVLCLALLRPVPPSASHVPEARKDDNDTSLVLDPGYKHASLSFKHGPLVFGAILVDYVRSGLRRQDLGLHTLTIASKGTSRFEPS